MKVLMKILMWFGLGTGLGYFIGDKVGFRRGSRFGSLRDRDEYVETLCKEERKEEPIQAMDEYRGEEEPEMPTEDEITIDEDIPQLHPQHLVPEIIGEEEYNANIWGYDLENLIFYELDEVLYNETTQKPEENPDQLIGVGTLYEFGGDPNNPVETIYVKNETFGTLYRIDRVDAAFCDAVDGTCGPEEDEPEEEEEDDFRQDDYWDDV